MALTNNHAEVWNNVVRRIGGNMFTCDEYTALYCQGIPYMDYNNYYSSNSSALSFVKDANSYTFTSWKTAGFDTHGISSNPDFISLSTGAEGFKLNTGSSALNAGIDRQDYDGDGNRTENINMGAYITGNETIGPSSGSPTPPPSSVTISSVNVTPSTVSQGVLTNVVIKLVTPTQSVTQITADLSNIGGSASQKFVYSNNGEWKISYNIPTSVTVGSKNIPIRAYAPDNKDTSVTVTVVTSTDKSITSFYFTSPTAFGSINNSLNRIDVTVPYGTNITSLTPTITFNGQSMTPSSGVAQNFSSVVNYRVTPASGNARIYGVYVTISSTTNTNPNQLARINFLSSTKTSGTMQDVFNTPVIDSFVVFYGKSATYASRKDSIKKTFTPGVHSVNISNLPVNTSLRTQIYKNGGTRVLIIDSTFTLSSSLSIFASPSSFNATLGQSCKIYNIQATSTIQILNVAGSITKDTSVTTFLPYFTWGGKDNSNFNAPAGIYNYKVTISGNIVGSGRIILLR